MKLFDRLLPPRCCTCQAPCPAAAGFCAECLLSFEPGARAVVRLEELVAVSSPWQYGGQLALAIERFKYFRQLPCGYAIARQIRAPLAAFIATTEPTCLIPVPMPFWRALRRGVVHAALLLELSLDKPSACRLSPGLLRRTRHRAPQAGLGREARLRNLRGAFAASNRLAGARVLLFDDVISTGATMRACATACLAAGARDVVGFAAAINQ
ncbi:MAG: ComF family protein [Myxococcales bacterium]|nr:ComF family protein [Myxococcales bacterium]